MAAKESHRFETTVQCGNLRTFLSRLNLLLHFGLGGMREFNNCVLDTARLVGDEQKTLLELIGFVADIALLEIACEVLLEVFCKGTRRTCIWIVSSQMLTYSNLSSPPTASWRRQCLPRETAILPIEKQNPICLLCASTKPRSSHWPS